MVLRPCLTQGCPEFTEGSYCERHDRGRQPLPDQRRPSYDSRWTKLRRSYIAKHPLCRACEAEGLVTPAQEVDHVVPWRGDQRLLTASWNLQSLCRPCHHRKTRADEMWAPLRFPMPPLSRNSPLLVFCGPPAAGKSTAARASGYPVLDLDDLYAELGVSARMVTIEVTIEAMRLRNERIVIDTPWALVATLPRQHERAFWREIWGAEVHQLMAPRALLLERINTRPPARRAQSLEALERWEREHEVDD